MALPVDPCVRRLPAVLCCLAALGGVSAAAAGQSSNPATIRTELSLGNGRSVAVVAASGIDPAATVVGVLELDGPIRLGTLELGKASTETRYNLRLDQAGAGWQVQVAAGDAATSVGAVSLAVRDGQPAVPSPRVALLPTIKDRGQLVLRWGSRQALVDIQFLRPLVVSRSLNNGRVNEPVSRPHFGEINPRQLRAMHLMQANATGLVLPDGRSLTLWTPRLTTDGPDFARLGSVGEGSVVELTQSAVPRFKFDGALVLAGKTLASDNLAAGFHGSYGLWLKRVSGGWHLVFSNHPDTWGSQYDPGADALEVALAHAQDGEASRPLGAALVADDASGGRLVLHWGPHTWSVPFQSGPTSR